MHSIGQNRTAHLMNSTEAKHRKWLTVATFAVAMAWVEAAVVFYLRTMINRVVPYQADPLPAVGNFGAAELVREMATLAMLGAVGVLAGSTWRSRVGYTAVAFGIWDIFYYVFLKVLTGCPHTLLDWDVLFLLPLPWWGSVLAPVLISLLLIMWGTIATQFEHIFCGCGQNWRMILSALTGAILALYVFMADTIRAAGWGVDAVRTVLPERFNWPLFMLALTLMAIPVVEAMCKVWQARRRTVGGARAEENFKCNRTVQG